MSALSLIVADINIHVQSDNVPKKQRHVIYINVESNFNIVKNMDTTLMSTQNIHFH